MLKYRKEVDMLSVFKKDFTINISHCDSSGRLSLSGMLSIFMDTAALHIELQGQGIDKLKKDGLYWIIGQNRVKIIKRPKLMQKVAIVTRLSAPGKFSGCRQYSITDENGELLIAGETMWLVYNKAEKKLVGLKEYVPESCEFFDSPFFSEKPVKPAKVLDPADKAGEYVVLPTDIDFIGHMNNSAYAKLILNNIPLSEQESREIYGADIFYLKQCLEGEKLSVYRHKGGACDTFYAVSEGGEFVMTANIYFDKEMQ